MSEQDAQRVNYSLRQLSELIEGARKLGFWDDVAHFTELRDELLEAQRVG